MKIRTKTREEKNENTERTHTHKKKQGSKMNKKIEKTTTIY